MLGLNQYINPIHFEIIEPLKKWKILSLKDLKADSNTGKSDASIYKIIKRLESFQVIDSFIDSWSKEKHIYLDKNAREHFAVEDNELIPRDRRYHDAITVKVMRKLLQAGHVREAYTECEVRRKLTSHDHIPDGAIQISKDNKDYLIAIEMELNQKNKKRIQEYFGYFEKSNNFCNAFYIFSRKSVYNTYREQLKELKGNRNKILLMYLKDLRLDNINFRDAIIYHNGLEKGFTDIFSSTNEVKGKDASNDDLVKDKSFLGGHLTS